MQLTNTCAELFAWKQKKHNSEKKAFANFFGLKMAEQQRKHYDSINILEEDANTRVADESGQGYFDGGDNSSPQEPTNWVRFLATQFALVFVAIVAIAIATAVVATALVSSRAFHAAQKPTCDARYVH